MLFQPAELRILREAFDDPGFIYELKQDGFRALAYIEPGRCQLVSRKGNVYKSFDRLTANLATLNVTAVLDGEIVILDSSGKPRFYDLLRRRGAPIFYAFDCLSISGIDLRAEPLSKRKIRLAQLVKKKAFLLPATHVSGSGLDVFRLVCGQDLEGIVAKRSTGAYGQDWFKIRNPPYSQYEGRRELFEAEEGMTWQSASAVSPLAIPLA